MERPKEKLYFSHDADARNDEKCVALRQKYGAVGYAHYWMLVEMMRAEVAAGYRLPLTNKFKWIALAMQMQCEVDALINFVEACIHEFKLFSADDHFFWSDSLLKRMKRMMEIREKRSESAKTRWGNANAKQVDANAKRKSPNKKEEIRKGTNTPISPFWFSSDEAVMKSWEAFIAMRKAKKKPPTDHAIDLLVSKLKTLCRGASAKAVAILDRSTVNGWQDIFEIKEGANASNQTGNGGYETRTQRDARKAAAIFGSRQNETDSGAIGGLLYGDGQGDSEPGLFGAAGGDGNG